MGLSKPTKLRVAIIGAGVSGLCSALFLRRLGHDVTVFEKDKLVKGEGAGIQLTSNGLFVLEKLKLGKLVLEAGLKPNNLCLFDETGEPISLKRLDARPIATLSVEAQERHERRERDHRDD